MAGHNFSSTTLPNGQKGYVMEVTEKGTKVKLYFAIECDPSSGFGGGLGKLVDKVPVE